MSVAIAAVGSSRSQGTGSDIRGGKCCLPKSWTQVLKWCSPSALAGMDAMSSGELIEKDCHRVPSVEVTSRTRCTAFSFIMDQSSSDRSCGPAETWPSKRRVSLRHELVLGRTESLENGRLLDEYALGTILGQGSFGIVFSCRRSNKQDTKDYAVKLIDKVESLPEDIVREVRMQESLDHPNILKVYEVIDEKCFVCIITDRCWGGDLVQSLKSHAHAGKGVRIGRITHIVKQMLDAIAYLHSKNLVHRDIKGDNFLLDRVNLMDSRCHVALADFGFACECQMGDRLKRRCGTRLYWPPEMWDRSYANKVDIWAMGVTLYGMVEADFPFHSEWEVKNKQAVLNPFLSPKCIDLINQLLIKVEFSRPSALQVLSHRWLSDDSSVNTNCDNAEGITLKDGVGIIHHDDGPDPGVAARRLELVGRLEDERRRPPLNGSSDGSITRKLNRSVHSESSLESANVTPSNILNSPSFDVLDRAGDKIRTFEWWSRDPLRKAGLDIPEGGAGQSAVQEHGNRRWSNEVAVGQMLEAHGIDTSLFGNGSSKTLARLANELELGASLLMMDATKHKALVRVVDLVLLRLAWRSSDGVRYLIVTADEQLDGRKRSDLNRLPGIKKRPHENLRNAAARIMMEIPSIEIEDIELDFENVEAFEEDEESLSYPGVRTVYRKQVVPGILKVAAVHGGLGVDAWRHLNGRSTKFFLWIDEEGCVAKRVKLWAPLQGAAVSSLVPAPIGLKVRALGRFLKANHIDPSAFGENQTKTIQELSTELITGASSLVSTPESGLVRMVDVVLLMVSHDGSDQVLVVTKETPTTPGLKEANVNRLPGTKRRPDENHFHAAKRVLQRQLKITENMVNIDADNVQIFEEEKESPSYPGLRTVYCKRIIKAQLLIAPPKTLGFSSRHTMSATSSMAVEGADTIDRNSFGAQRSRFRGFFGRKF